MHVLASKRQLPQLSLHISHFQVELFGNEWAGQVNTQVTLGVVNAYKYAPVRHDVQLYGSL